MHFTYNPLLVALSVLVATQASYVGLSLAQHISGSFAFNRRMLIAGSALSLSVGIWGMHFIGMLAAKSSVSIDYAVLPTLVSFLVCMLVTGIAIYLASLRAPHMLVIAAAVMGLGIAAMHYIGMMAVHSSIQMTHNPSYIFASILIACGTCGLALWLAFAARRQPPLLLCATVLGCAISGMHYTAMAGTTLHMTAVAMPAGSAISSEFLAAIVSIVAFAVSGAFMLILIPGEARDMQGDARWSATADQSRATPAETFSAESFTAPRAPKVSDAPVSNEVFLPVEKNGTPRTINAGDIISVHANAHYTYLFNGRDDLFCPLSISDIAARLPVNQFFRVHRSYIVNLAHVANVRKAGDAGVAELDSPQRRTVPISRNRVQILRQELARQELARQDLARQAFTVPEKQN